MHPYLLMTALLFAFLFWGSLIFTVVIVGARAFAMLAVWILHAIWTVVLALAFCVVWVFNRRLAREYLRGHR